MAKDRYSSDHEIEVVGDTQTLLVRDNLKTVEDLTAGVKLNTNLISARTGSEVVVSDDFIMDSDAECRGTLEVTRMKGDTGLFSCKVLYHAFLADTNISFTGVNLAPFGFTGSTTVFGLQGTLQPTGATDLMVNGGQTAIDYSFGLEYRQSTTSLIIYFNGADFPVAGGTATIRVVIWYT